MIIDECSEFCPGQYQFEPLKNLDGQLCQICGVTVEVTPNDGEFFASVCRPCYECERKDGNQCCHQCKARYMRLKGSPRVKRDEEEEDVDDIKHEFNYARGARKAKQQ